MHGDVYNRLELSVEYLVLQSQWRELFTDQQLARNRLEERNFAPPEQVITSASLAHSGSKVGTV
jgi:hypothetical protein